MSRYIPHSAVQREFIAQAVRRSVGLKDGRYVRARDQRGRVGTATLSTVKKHQLTVLTEAEYEAALKPKKKVTKSEPNEINGVNFELGDEIDISNLPYEQQVALLGKPMADALADSEPVVETAYTVTSVDTAAGTLTVGQDE